MSQEPLDISFEFRRPSPSFTVKEARFGSAMARPQIGPIRSVGSRFLVPISSSSFKQAKPLFRSEEPFFADFHRSDDGRRQAASASATAKTDQLVEGRRREEAAVVEESWRRGADKNRAL